MNSKLICVLLLAVVGASQAANIQAKPEPKDLRVVIANVIKIIRIIGEKIQTGIAEAKPVIDDLEAELNAALAQDVEDLLLKIEGIVNEITARIQTLEKEVTDAIAALDTEAGACVTAADKELDPVLDKAEADISTQWRAILANNEGNITSLETQIRSIITDLDTATDKAIADGVACVKKGSTDVKTCLDANTEAWNAAVQTALVNLALVLNELLAYAPLLIGELVNAIKPIVDEVLVEADPVWVHFGECVAAL